MKTVNASGFVTRHPAIGGRLSAMTAESGRVDVGFIGLGNAGGKLAGSLLRTNGCRRTPIRG